MSLTNDQIMAKNFQDFYAQIRPYLNGQVPPVFNKFSKSDLYSTDERIVGQWVDGKPLYQKTLIDTTAVTGSGTLDISISSLGADYITVQDFQFVSTTNCTPICWNNGSMLAFINYIDSNIISITYSTGIAAARMSKGYRCTLQYTKIADNPVSIGNDTDYSTTEKIVGTWIDGKPVYQRTVTFTFPQYSSDSKVDIEVLNNVSTWTLRDVFGYANALPVNCSWASNEGNYYFNRISIGNGKLVFQTNRPTFYSEADCIFTVQYTKTTD